MTLIYEVHIGMKRQDYTDEAEAIRVIEAYGSGYVVTYVIHNVGRFNSTHRSRALRAYEDNKWRDVSIHGY